MLNEQEYVKIFTESLLLKKRTGRYVLNEEKQWNKVKEIEDIEEICVRLVGDFFKSKFNEWNSMRKESARANLIKRASEISFNSVEECDQELARLSYEILGKKYYILGRMDAIDVLGLVYQNEAKLKYLGVALLIGKWTSEPSCQLRRFLGEIEIKYKKYPDLVSLLKEEISKEAVCNRPPEKPNRHGHHVENRFPGIMGWTQEYNDKIKCVKKNSVETKLSKMKEYTNYYDKLTAELKDPDCKLGNNRKNLIFFLMNYVTDLSQLNTFYAIIENIRKKPSIDELRWDQNVNEKIQELTIKIGKKAKPKNKILQRMNAFVSLEDFN